MNIFNIDMFLADSEWGGIAQFIGALAIVIVTLISSKKAAQKKEEEHKQKRQQLQNQQSARPAPNYAQNRAKYWGVQLEKVEETPVDDEYDDDYEDYDDDDYDPLEPQPAHQNFARRVATPVNTSEEKLGSLQNSHLQSSFDQEKFQSEIEMQKFISDLDNLGELPDSANLISDDDYDDDEDHLNIQIKVAKGSPEALVHAVVLGEIFAPPLSMRKPYAQTDDDDEGFQNSTLF